jgi:hypothetical protein
LQLATCNLQPATCNLQPARCGNQQPKHRTEDYESMPFAFSILQQ